MYDYINNNVSKWKKLTIFIEIFINFSLTEKDLPRPICRAKIKGRNAMGIEQLRAVAIVVSSVVVVCTVVVISMINVGKMKAWDKR